MDHFKQEALNEFKEKVMYIGAFVDGPLPKTEKILSEELPNRNPDGGNHVTLFYLGDYPEIGECLFDDILALPEGFTACVSGYGFDGKNQGISVSSDEYDFENSRLYGNTKATPHVTYSWDEIAGGMPVGTGKLDFHEIPALESTKLKLRIKAYLFSDEMIPLQYFRDRAIGVIPPMSAGLYSAFSSHNQNTPYHCYDLRMHTIKVTEYVQNNAIAAGVPTDLRIPLVVAAQWHDIGKLFTKSQDENGFNVYPNHPKASAELFDKVYVGNDKALISFFISNHDSFLFYNKSDLTDALVASVKAGIQEKTPFTITFNDWRALTLLMEADESAKNPVVRINGRVVRTLEEDIEKVRYLTKKICDS